MANWIKTGSKVIWHGGTGAEVTVESGLLVRYFSDYATTSHGVHGIAYSGGMTAEIKLTGSDERFTITPKALRKDTPANRAKLYAKAKLMTEARRKRLGMNKR